MTTFVTVLIEAVIVGIALIFIKILVNKLDFRYINVTDNYQFSNHQ